MTIKIPNKTIGEIAAYYKGLFYANSELLTSEKNIIEMPVVDIKKIIKSMNIKLKYQNSSVHCHKFGGIYLSSKMFDVSVYVYNNKYNDQLKKTILEIQILQNMGNLITNGITPHIIMPVAAFNTKTEHFKNIPKECVNGNNNYAKFQQAYKHNQLEKFATVFITEFCDGGTLLQFINNTQFIPLRIWIILFFQIISTIQSINKHYPNLVCANIEPSKIKIQNVDPCSKNLRYRYDTAKHKYIIPNICMRLKIYDFSESYYTKKNNNYDVNFFLTSMEKTLEPNKAQVPIEIIEFIERNKYLSADEIISNDPLFEKYRFSIDN
ncbi:F10-like kinase [Tupanvirus soda lake]|uniref:F10-like kinase n=2 Tax=Tupanvirus TaxID=2094720 RepID=A0A6N1NMA2_9VIRU|nr:F10-like kinase [Tupanvirus soda lake]QKU35579.1 F10-like kinase [Tupanvirus soda lake]